MPRQIGQVMDYLKAELLLAAKDGGEAALRRMFDNGKKHLFNDGEYCVSFTKWAGLCRKAGFDKSRSEVCRDSSGSRCWSRQNRGSRQDRQHRIIALT